MDVLVSSKNRIQLNWNEAFGLCWILLNTKPKVKSVEREHTTVRFSAQSVAMTLLL